MMTLHPRPVRAALLALAAATMLAGLLPRPGLTATGPTGPDADSPTIRSSTDKRACQFAIMADNNIGEDVWILFSESSVYMDRLNVFSYRFDGMSNRRLAPGEKLNVRYEAPGSCNASRNWHVDVRIGPRGGERIRVFRETEDRNDRTVHLGESACWATAQRSGVGEVDRAVGFDDDPFGCDPSTTRYGLAPEPEEDEPGGGAEDDPPGDEVTSESLSSLQGEWVRVESNNPRNNGMRIRVEGDRATITAMPPRGSSRLRVGQVVWDDVSGDGSLAVRGSDGALYPSKLTMEGSNRLQLDIDLENSPGNDQTWERAGPSIDGDWVLVRMYTTSPDPGGSLVEWSFESNEKWNRGVRIRVEGDRAVIRYVPPTADRGLRVGDIAWREIGPSEDVNWASLEARFGGSSYAPARLDVSAVESESFIHIYRDDPFMHQDWARPGRAEELMASDDDRAERRADREDEDEAALLDVPREPVGDPSAQDPDLEPSDDMKTVDVPEDPTPPVREQAPEEEAACLATSLRHDQMDVAWNWGITEPPSIELLSSATLSWDETSREQYEMGAALPRYEDPGQRYGVVVDVERSRVPGLDDHHSYIWRQGNPYQRVWQDHRDLTASELEARIASYSDQGFRPMDLEGYSTTAGTRYAGIWVDNREGVDWLSDFDLTSSEYGALYRERRDAGYRLVDVEAYPLSGDIRFAGIWYRSCDNTNWRQWRNMTRDRYTSRVDSLSALGFRVVDFESYRTSQGQRYAAIWEVVPGRAWAVRTDRTLKQFLNWHHRYVDEGYRLIDYESYDTDSGVRYGGVWAENDPRYRYAAKADINDSIADYRETNELPGMSVVIIQNGDVVYRRGFGWADSVAQKRAHSETVYLTASISKVIGATLAARLEEQGLLDLADSTADYLQDPVGMVRVQVNGRTLYQPPGSIPGHHTHTVEQLLSKTSCVPHYREGNAPNESRFYAWRVEALDQIWNDPLLANCTPGQHYRYSTHGFTYVGAVLEAVTGRNIAELLQDEIARPFDLPSMRAMYTDDGSDGFLVNYDRAQAYSLTITNSSKPPPGPNNPTVRAEYSPNASWKVLGGGIEAHALDLAQFGWKLLDGEIVSGTVRDGRLWTSLTDNAASWVDQSTNPPSTPPTAQLPSGGVGMAWLLGGSMSATNGRSVRHGGSAVGAGTYLKIWRDRDLVIAMLSNRRDHDNLTRNSLLDRLANIVLTSTPP